MVLKMLWHRAKDVPDVHALLTVRGDGFDADYACETLAGLLPDDDPRLAELDDLIARYCG